MKKTLLFLCCLIIFGLMACNKKQEPMSNVTPQHLQHHAYAIVKVNGEAFPAMQEMPYIEFTENMFFSGKICNYFRGQATLVDSTLTAPNTAATRMMCSANELNDLEMLLFSMLQKGAKVSLTENQLTLEEGTNSLEFTLRDWVK